MSIRKYLGFLLGPAADGSSWSAPSSKFSLRCKAIAESKASPFIELRLYNARAASTLTYIEQLEPLPHRFHRSEVSGLNRILHAPANTFSGDSLYGLDSIGVGPPVHLHARDLAAMFRMAVRTIPDAVLKAVHLPDLALDAGVAVYQVVQGLFWDSHWQSPALLSSLCAAASGEHTDRRIATATQKCYA